MDTALPLLHPDWLGWLANQSAGREHWQLCLLMAFGVFH
jgi:hypothetical protein